MSLRLQLENGKIKEYRTWLDTSTDAGRIPGRYVTKCGYKCDTARDADKCSHLECAKYVAEQEAEVLIFLPAAIIGFSVVFMMLFQWDWMSWIKEALFLWGLSLLVSLFYSKDKRELKEFEDKGTINGLRAWKL